VPGKVLLAGIIILLIPGLGLAQTKHENNREEKKAQSQIHPRPKEYFADVLIPHLGQGAKASFSENNIPYFLLSAAAAALAYGYDEDAKQFWIEKKPLRGWTNVGNSFGDGYTQAALALGFWAAGSRLGSQKIATTGEVLIEAEIINGISTAALKTVAGRDRPDHSDNQSFPSGHTSASFCFASVIDSRLGHRWAIPAYSLAILTGLSRMESDKHWLSDVVMAAGLGMITGYSVSGHHDDWPYQKRWHHTDGRNPRERSFLTPIFPENGAGLGLAIYIPLN